MKRLDENLKFGLMRLENQFIWSENKTEAEVDLTCDILVMKE